MALPPTIRAARPDDAPAIAKSLLEALQFDGTLSESDLPDLVQRAIAAIDGDQETMLVAELDGDAAAYAHVHWVSALFLPGPEGYVTELFVQRGARGRGCGSALVQSVEAIAVERKAARLFLLNGRQSEAYSGGFYPRHRFVEAAHLAVFRRELSIRIPSGLDQGPAGDASQRRVRPGS